MRRLLCSNGRLVPEADKKIPGVLSHPAEAQRKGLRLQSVALAQTAPISCTGSNLVLFRTGLNCHRALVPRVTW
jgi:hypothetical protein